eukprot:EG_transcript_17007
MLLAFLFGFGFHQLGTHFPLRASRNFIIDVSHPSVSNKPPMVMQPQRERTVHLQSRVGAPFVRTPSVGVNVIVDDVQAHHPVQNLIAPFLAAIGTCTMLWYTAKRFQQPQRSNPLSMFAVVSSVQDSKVFPKIKLTYFAIEGAAEKVRLAMVLSGIPFEDEHVPFPEWQKIKPTVKFGQLPLMTVDGAAPLAQSEAMLRYVGRLGGLYPEDKAPAIDEAIGLVADLARAWAPSLYIAMKPSAFGYPADFQKTEEGQRVVKAVRTDFVAGDLKRFFGYFERLLGDGAFITGDAPTIADCTLVPMLRGFLRGTIEHVPTTCMEEHPKLKAYIDRFMALPRVAEWYRSKESKA